jgi:hypothetical protein
LEDYRRISIVNICSDERSTFSRLERKDIPKADASQPTGQQLLITGGMIAPSIQHGRLTDQIPDREVSSNKGNARNETLGSRVYILWWSGTSV